jgi:hypothetical protein
MPVYIDTDYIYSHWIQPTHQTKRLKYNQIKISVILLVLQIQYLLYGQDIH